MKARRRGACVLLGIFAATLWAGPGLTATELPGTPYAADWIEQFGTKGDDRVAGLQYWNDQVIVAGTRPQYDPDGDHVTRGFITSLDPTGDVIWSDEFIDDPFQYRVDVRGLSTAATGTSYLVGNYLEHVEDNFLDRGFLTAYSSAGDELWTLDVSGSEVAPFIPLAVTTDETGSVFLAGATTQEIWDDDLDDYVTHNNAVLQKRSATGELIWERVVDSPLYAVYRAVDPDGIGGVVVAGNTSDEVDGKWRGGADIFLRRYDGTGSVVWAEQFGTSRNDHPVSVLAEPDGEVVLAGSTDGALARFNPRWMGDAFVRKYATDGAVAWTRQWGNEWGDTAQGLEEHDGYYAVLGWTEGEGDMRLLDADGNSVWRRRLDAGQVSVGPSQVVSAPEGRLYIGGWVVGLYGNKWVGHGDAFVSKYVPQHPRKVVARAKGHLRISGSVTVLDGKVSCSAADVIVSRYASRVGWRRVKTIELSAEPDGTTSFSVDLPDRTGNWSVQVKRERTPDGDFCASDVRDVVHRHKR